MIIAIDFDGTIVKHRYPEIGEDIGAFPVLKKWVSYGHRLILYTMRSGRELDQAIEYCKKNGIEFWGINKNPEQHTWTKSPKVYANLYIDDAGFGVPLIVPPNENDRPFVNWDMLRFII